MILRQGDVTAEAIGGSHPRTEARIGAAGGLAGLGANVVTLLPGQVSSERHWHAESDEFLLVLEGVATVVEEDGPHDLSPGDCACWPAGVANAHHVVNRSAAPVRFPVAGTRPATDLCRYPDSGSAMHHAPPDWWVEADDGMILRRGKV